MVETITRDWEIFIEQYPQLISLQRALSSEEWYTRDGWTMFIGHYFAGIYAQVFKPHWFNQAGDGIHLEFGLDEDSLAEKVVRIDLHIGHRNLFDRQAFNEWTVQKIEAATHGFNLSRFSKTNLSDRLSLEVKFSKTGFPRQLAEALTRLSVLGPIIDDGLTQCSQ